MALLVRRYEPHPKVVLEGVWDDATKSKSPDEWRRALYMLIDARWPDRAAAMRELERLLELYVKTAAAGV